MKTKEQNTAVAVKENETVKEKVASTNNVEKAIGIASDLIEPSNYNARKTFDPEALAELAQNIKVHGLIQPITVRKKGNRYEIICGERRFRACRMLNMTEIPAHVRELTDEQAYDLSISENLQREDVPPMEAAEAYKHLIDTKRYDIASIALQFGKSEKTIYQTIKLCDLIKDIANLVREGKLTASAGIVISKYDKKIQEAIFKERLGKDGNGDWAHYSAGVLSARIEQVYTNDLDNYSFDKTACMKCPFNSNNFDIFSNGTSSGRCAKRKCLDDKNTAHIVSQAETLAKTDPKIAFVGDPYSYGNEPMRQVKSAGYEFKNVYTYNLKGYPTTPSTPEASKYPKPEDFEKALAKYNNECAQYEKRTSELNSLKEQGRIRVYAQIGDKGIRLFYKEVSDKNAKSDSQLIAELTSKKERNNELQAEKTAESIKELLRTAQLPQSPFSPQEEQAMYFFMLSDLRRKNYKTIGLKEDDYYRMSDEAKMKVVASLTEEQKTVIRRDYLYEYLIKSTSVTNTKGNMLLSFAKQHLPEQTAKIEATHKQDYDKRNARLDERIDALNKAEKNAKATTKEKKQDQPAEVSKKTKTDGKNAKSNDKPTKVEVTPKSRIAPAKSKDKVNGNKSEPLKGTSNATTQKAAIAQPA